MSNMVDKRKTVKLEHKSSRDLCMARRSNSFKFNLLNYHKKVHANNCLSWSSDKGMISIKEIQIIKNIGVKHY